MLFALSLDLPPAQQQLEQAIQGTLAAGYRTADIVSPGTTLVTTEEMRDGVLEALEDVLAQDFRVKEMSL
jgi:urease gamma subunit